MPKNFLPHSHFKKFNYNAMTTALMHKHIIKKLNQYNQSTKSNQKLDPHPVSYQSFI